MSADRFFLTIIFMAILLAAGWLFCRGIQAIEKARKSAGWPSAEGVVNKSEVVETTSTSDGQTYHYFAPRVQYSYEAGGRLRTGDVIAFGLEGIATDGSFARRYCARYPVGKRVTVHYHPVRVETSVLEPGLSIRTFIPVALGCGFALVAGAFAFLAYRSL